MVAAWVAPAERRRHVHLGLVVAHLVQVEAIKARVAAALMVARAAVVEAAQADVHADIVPRSARRTPRRANRSRARIAVRAAADAQVRGIQPVPRSTRHAQAVIDIVSISIVGKFA